MATSKILTAQETTIVFQNSSSDGNIGLASLAAGIGRISPRVDRGSASRTTKYRMQCTFQKGVAGVVNEAILVYISTSDGTHPDGEVGTVDAALTAAQAANLRGPYPVIVPFTTTNTDFTKSFDNVIILGQYFSVGVINSPTGALGAGTNVNRITFTPMPEEAQ